MPRTRSTTSPAVHERQRPVLELSGGIAFSMDIGNFFQFQRPLIRGRHIDPAPQVETVFDKFEHPGDLFDLWLTVQATPGKIRHFPQVSHQLHAALSIQNPSQVTQ